MSSARAIKRLKTHHYDLRSTPVAEQPVSDEEQKSAGITSPSETLHQFLKSRTQQTKDLEATVTNLLTQGALVNYRPSGDSHSTYYYALTTGNPQIIKSFLNAGADVNEVMWGRDGKVTPLILVAESRSASAARVLLEHEKPANTESVYTGVGKNMTALLIAADDLEPELFQVLMAFNANPKHRSIWGGNALNYAAEAMVRELDELSVMIDSDDKMVKVIQAYNTITSQLAPYLKDEPVIARPFDDVEDEFARLNYELEYKKITAMINALLITERQKMELVRSAPSP